MSSSSLAAPLHIFTSRLDTLAHLLQVGAAHFNEPEVAYLARRLAPDMHPLGTQVAFTCNQARNFALWVAGKEASDLDPNVASLPAALRHIEATQHLLAECARTAPSPPPRKHLTLGPTLYADLTGAEYLDDFLLPNFHFHLVTAYAILRHHGVPLGKPDYMRHLLPRVQQRQG